MRVGVLGAGGRMGAEVCRAVVAAEGLELVAAVDPHGEGAAAGGVAIRTEREALTESGVEVAVDFTRPDTVVDNVTWLLDNGIHAVVGTTGLTADDLESFRVAAGTSGANCLVAPNFAIGAVLMMQFAAEAARHLSHVEIIERHHDQKLDAPSGTALRTAELIAEAAGDDLAPPVGGDEAHPGASGTVHHGVTVHSVRLPGLVAHQEVQLGGPGETLTIRHDSIHRESFMPGVLLAIRRVAGLDGVVVGLEHLLGLGD